MSENISSDIEESSTDQNDPLTSETTLVQQELDETRNEHSLDPNSVEWSSSIRISSVRHKRGGSTTDWSRKRSQIMRLSRDRKQNDWKKRIELKRNS